MTMHSEIQEQPEVITNVLERNQERAHDAARIMSDTTHGLIAGRGTSDNAGRYAQYVWGAANNYAVGLTTPSLFSVYADPPRIVNAMTVGISQSGQSPDIVSVLAQARAQSQPTVAITNDPASPLAGEADVLLELHAGEEKSVAATKTYTSELANIALISTAGDPGSLRAVIDGVGSVLESGEEIAKTAQKFTGIEHCAVIARGHNHATAFELALKLQELTYAVAQPFSTADFLHGPVAVLEPGYPVIAIAITGPTLADVVEVIDRSRDAGAQVLTITDDQDVAAAGEHSILLPSDIPEWLTPISTIVAGQLFVYHLATAMGLDVEQPRGLRKVTKTL